MGERALIRWCMVVVVMVVVMVVVRVKVTGLYDGELTVQWASLGTEQCHSHTTPVRALTAHQKYEVLQDFQEEAE